MRFCFLVLFFCFTGFASAAELEIHSINVGWGSSVIVRGPDGTTVLLEAGRDGKGTGEVVPYLKSIGIQPQHGLDYVIGGHQHCDHVGGLDEVLAAGYDVRRRQYFNGSASTNSCVSDWNAAAALTSAGAPVAMPVGTVIELGQGARMTCVASNGSVIGGAKVSVSDENDRSLALLIQFGGFDYLWASDVGGGDADEPCTGRSTSQRDVESAIIAAISPGGASPLISAGGIDVLYVNHHGSESSTNANYMNGARPEVAVIATGAGQSGFELPRIAVVERVLYATVPCINVPPALVLQTEEGAPKGTQTSTAGYAVGDIVIRTDGVLLYSVSANGAVTQGPEEVAAAGLPRTFTLDDVLPDSAAPGVSLTSPAAGSVVAGLVEVSASATDNVGVVVVEFLVDDEVRATDTAAPFSWTWNTTEFANGEHRLRARAYDAAGNAGTSEERIVTVRNSGRRRAVRHP